MKELKGKIKMNQTKQAINAKELHIKDYQQDSESKNGDLYTIIETVVTTYAGLVVARKVRERWTDHRFDRINGKDHVYESDTIVKDDIGYFAFLHQKE